MVPLAWRKHILDCEYQIIRLYLLTNNTNFILDAIYTKITRNGKYCELFTANIDKKCNFSHCLGALEKINIVMKAFGNFA